MRRYGDGEEKSLHFCSISSWRKRGGERRKEGGGKKREGGKSGESGANSMSTSLLQAGFFSGIQKVSHPFLSLPPLCVDMCLLLPSSQTPVEHTQTKRQVWEAEEEGSPRIFTHGEKERERRENHTT